MLGAAAQPWDGTEPVTQRSSKAPIPALPGTPKPGQLRLRLSPSLLPAPAANGDDRSRAAARDAGCHAGIVHGVGSHGAGALGMGVAARQRPAIVTGHHHLTGRTGHPPQVSKGAGVCPSPMVPRAQGDVAGVTLSRWTPAGGAVPLQVGNWGHQ